MNKLAGWITGLLVAFGLSALALHYYVPPLPAALDLTITFAEKNLTEGEPLAVTGEPGEGDFLYVKFLDTTTVAFGYDRWGAGGPVSAPVKILPGVRYALHVESPSLTQVRGSIVRGPEKLRVVFNGAVVLEVAVPLNFRHQAHAWFAENPINGTACGPRFSGELSRADGRPLRGSVRRISSPGEKFAAWLNYGRWQVLGVLLAGAVAGLLTARLGRTSREEVKSFFLNHRAGPHRWFITAAAPCVIVFAWFITDGTGQFAYDESFGNFYDFQAASLLQFRLDVPTAALSGEAFVVGGKYYGYFGVTPALLRLPCVIYDLEFGCLSRSFMLVYFVACLIAANALLRHATRKWRGSDARPTPFATVLFTGCVGLGSTLLFLGSRAYIYHEAILCGAMFTLWSAWWALRWLDAPGSRAWLCALVCGLLAVHARPTSGLFALTLLAATAVAVALNGEKIRRPMIVAASAVAGVLSFNGLSFLKFGTFDGSPLKYSVQYNPERRAKFGDQNFHLANLHHNLDAYVFRPDFRIERRFPWYYGGDFRPHHYPEAKIDLAEITVGMPFAMPGLFALAVAGGAWAARRAPPLRQPLVLIWLSVLPMALALCTAIVISQRYTADFCPWLIAGGAFALPVLDFDSGWRRQIMLGVVSVLAAGSVAATLALALRFQGELVWGVPAATQQNYQQLRLRVDNFFGVSSQP